MSHTLLEYEFLVQGERNRGCRDEHQETSEIHVHIVPFEDSQSSDVQEVDKDVYHYEPENQGIVVTIEHQPADGLEVEQNTQDRRKEDGQCIMNLQENKECIERISENGVQNSYQNIFQQ
jgi:hypothetical protein